MPSKEVGIASVLWIDSFQTLANKLLVKGRYLFCILKLFIYESQQGIEKSLLNLYSHRKHAHAVWHMIQENVERRSKVPKASINLTLFRLVSCRNTEVIFVPFFVGDIKIQCLAKKFFIYTIKTSVVGTTYAFSVERNLLDVGVFSRFGAMNFFVK